MPLCLLLAPVLLHTPSAVLAIGEAKVELCLLLPKLKFKDDGDSAVLLQSFIGDTELLYYFNYGEAPSIVTNDLRYLSSHS